MKNLGSTFFIFLLITIGYLFFGSWYWPCKVKGLCGNAAANVATNPPSDPSADEIGTPQTTANYFSQPFRLMENGQVVMEDESGIRFGKNSATPVFGSGIAGKLGDLVNKIQENDLKDLVITGIYSPKDQMPEGLQLTNLGLARANAFRQLLLDRGIPANRMISLYERSDDANLYNDLDSLQGGIKLELASRSSDGEAIKNPLSEPFYVYFETGSSYVKLDADLRGKITKTIQFLNSNEGSNLTLTGHTDDQGQAENNLKLGLDRANDLAKTFIEFGLLPDQIGTASKGEDAPIASNDTPEGRAKNRRVEMQIPNEN
jgi:outer membrane protein OmpA-like peptidoglycan-associated protein